jgi:FHS family L-fucose permease-like MFS transporter
MFPTIFTLGIRGLGPLTEEGAGLLIMAIAGGCPGGGAGLGWPTGSGSSAPSCSPPPAKLYVLFYALRGSRTGAAAPRPAGA